MMTCPTCAGTRRITRTVPNMCGPSNNRYQSSIKPEVTRNYVCPDCAGRGQIDCPICFDRGEYAAADEDGHYYGIEYCNCDAGRALMDAERQALNDAEFDAFYAWEAAHLNAPVEYGMTVAIDQIPF